MKKKVIVSLLLAIIAIVGSVGITNAHASTIDISSPSAYLIEYETGTVMFEKNAEAKRPIASMVKIMTLLLSFEYVESGAASFTDMVRVSENAAGMGGSQAFLDANSEYSIDELIKSITIASANDACVAMAETVSGSVEGFVARMNEKAAELGMTSTNFVNCTGLPAEGQYSCAKDVAKMTKELLKHPHYYTYSNIWMYDIVHPSGRVTGLTNTNKLVRFYEGCDGGKTGFTNEAMFCLSATARRNGMRVISVVIGAKDSKIRNAEVSKLFNYAFANYECKQVVLPELAMEERAEVVKGMQDSVGVRVNESFAVFGEKGKTAGTENIVELDRVNAPIAEGDRVGTLKVVQNGEVIKEIEVVSTENVRAKRYFDYLKDISDKW